VAVTIKDIARKAGVSHSTVSRALRDSAAIAPQTVWRIKRLAARMGYVPSAVARSLKHWGSSSPTSPTPSSVKLSTVSKKSSWKPATTAPPRE